MALSCLNTPSQGISVHLSSYLLPLGLLLLLALPAQAELLCAPTKPEIVITPLIGNVNLDNSHTQKEIQILSGVGQVNRSHYGSITLGLTLTSVTSNSRISAETRTDHQNRACAVITSLHISFGFSPHIVYIPKAYAPATCAYNAIYSHEMKHVNLDHEFLAEQVPLVQARLASSIPPIATVLGRDGDDLQKTLRQRVETVMTALQTEVSQTRQQRQALVDSPGEYMRVMNSCDDMIYQALNPPR